MKLSIHNTIKGKPVSAEDLDGRTWLESQGQRVNLGYGWVNIDVDWPTAFELITVDGCASSAELTNDNRCASNFVSRQLIMVDIDSGMTIEELFQDDFYNMCGAGFYTTPSHKDHAHRFRIMFITQTPITDSESCRLLMIALMRLFDSADPSCKDSTRIFYGTPNCLLKERTDNILPDEVVAELIAGELERKQQRQAQAQLQTKDYDPVTREQVETLLNDLLKCYPLLEYHQRRDVTWAVLSAGISANDTIALLRPRWPDHDLTGKYEMFVGDHKNSSITLGTVYHMIRQHDPNYKKIHNKSQEIEYNRQLLQAVEAELTRRKNDRFKSVV